MKTIKILYGIFWSLMITVTFSAVLLAADAPLQDKQWEAPVMPGGTLLKTEDTAVLISYAMPYEKVLEWYKKALENYKDEKYRDWQDQMYIEDQGGAKWHSIGISKGGGTNTTVRIVKDNWAWIFSTLLIRFAGVFAILLTLWILLSISNAIMKKLFAKKTVKPQTG